MAQEKKPNTTLALYRAYRKRVNERHARELEKTVRAVVGVTAQTPVMVQPPAPVKVVEDAPPPTTEPDPDGEDKAPAKGGKKA